MNLKTINIVYIDDESDARYGPFFDLKEYVDNLQNESYNIEIAFFQLKDEKTQDIFWERLMENEYQGIILDYRLLDSGIFEDASSIWKKVKLNNPFFPLAIYTSHTEEVSLHKESEKAFEKGNPEDLKTMFKYLMQQIDHNLETIEVLKRTNNELKSNESVSYKVLKNEEQIEKQFSMFFDNNTDDENEEKFKILMNKAFEIIDKYENGR